MYCYFTGTSTLWCRHRINIFMDPRGNNRPQNIEKETQLLYNLRLVLDLEKKTLNLTQNRPLYIKHSNKYNSLLCIKIYIHVKYLVTSLLLNYTKFPQFATFSSFNFKHTAVINIYKYHLFPCSYIQTDF